MFDFWWCFCYHALSWLRSCAHVQDRLLFKAKRWIPRQNLHQRSWRKCLNKSQRQDSVHAGHRLYRTAWRVRHPSRYALYKTSRRWNLGASPRLQSDLVFLLPERHFCSSSPISPAWTENTTQGNLEGESWTRRLDQEKQLIIWFLLILSARMTRYRLSHFHAHFRTSCQKVHQSVLLSVSRWLSVLKYA